MDMSHKQSKKNNHPQQEFQKHRNIYNTISKSKQVKLNTKKNVKTEKQSHRKLSWSEEYKNNSMVGELQK